MNKTFIKSLFCTMSLLFSTGTFFAQTSVQRTNNPININLSLWKGLSTQSIDSLSQTNFNIGVSSYLNRLNGLSLNIIGSSVQDDINGVQIAGISNMNKGTLKGLQIAGVTNIIGKDLIGVSLSGLVGITGNKANGILTSGLGNIYNSAHGVVLSGLLNFGSSFSSGIHFAGIADISGESFTGFSSSGMLNVTGKDMKGVQLSGLANITGENMQGIQIATIGNVTGSTANGVQVGLINMATRAKGLQIGLFNYYKESLNGFQIGLVNTNPHTRIQLMLFGGNTTKTNIAVRFKNQLFYTILGGGSHYLDFGNKLSAAAFYRAGIGFSICKNLYIGGDLGYQHIETFKNKNYGVPERLYALQTRLNLEYQINKKIGAFITTGYGGSRPYKQHYTYEKGVILEGGIILF